MELLKNLCLAGGISGNEGEAADIVKAELEKFCDDVSTDSFGNVIGRKGKGGKKFLIAAHIDEIGLMVKYISKEGFIILSKSEALMTECC